MLQTLATVLEHKERVIVSLCYVNSKAISFSWLGDFPQVYFIIIILLIFVGVNTPTSRERGVIGSTLALGA